MEKKSGMRGGRGDDGDTACEPGPTVPSMAPGAVGIGFPPAIHVPHPIASHVSAPPLCSVLEHCSAVLWGAQELHSERAHRHPGTVGFPRK